VAPGDILPQPESKMEVPAGFPKTIRAGDRLMESHLISQGTRFNSRCVSRSLPFLAVLLFAMQLAAQNPIIQDSADHAQVAAPVAGQLATGSQQIADPPLAPLPTWISTPAPAQEEANLSSPRRIPFLALAAGLDSSQSSSQSAPATVPPAKTTATGTKPAHHGLGVALAVVGTAALVAGVALYVGEQHAYCNSSSTGCNEAKDIGIALMPIGGGVAATGFYFEFHH
jgi:hypothetical protein